MADRIGPLRLLVLGGSLGARALNQALPQALALWSEDQRPQVLHQSGQDHLGAVWQAYTDAGLTAEVRPFIDDMLTSSLDRGPPSSVIVTYADSVSRNTSSIPDATPGVDSGNVT